MLLTEKTIQYLCPAVRMSNYPDILVILQAQRDLVKAHYDHLIEQAVAAEREGIFKWGNEECFEHPYSSRAKGEQFNRKHHRCPDCWQTLKGGN